MDELDLIARFPGADDATALAEEEVRARARDRVMLTIVASEADLRHSQRPARSPAPRILRLGIAAAIGAVILALIVPVAFTDSSGSSASAALLRLAETANAGVGWESPTDDEFIYIRSMGESPRCKGGSCVLEPFARESWIAPDGSGRVVETRDGQSSDETFGAGDLVFQDLHEILGWSQPQVRRHLGELAGVEDADDFTLFVVIGELMGETRLLPETRIALFEIAASFPDTELLGSTADQLGRSGIGVGYSSEGLRYEVIFDEDTALVLEQRVSETRDGAEPISIAAVPGGWLVAGSLSTYEASGLVASTDERL
jgi:hypothetical protein